MTAHTTLAEALTAAFAAAAPGDAILFSPAFASFDQYPNFRARALEFHPLARPGVRQARRATRRRPESRFPADGPWHSVPEGDRVHRDHGSQRRRRDQPVMHLAGGDTGSSNWAACASSARRSPTKISPEILEDLLSGLKAPADRDGSGGRAPSDASFALAVA
ncbi:MAG: hypothetical protein IPK26_27880 [Planctomycetes bacterium]|nr:hypothetical protein [Planctomycetota bacterium]